MQFDTQPHESPLTARTHTCDKSIYLVTWLSGRHWCTMCQPKLFGGMLIASHHPYQSHVQSLFYFDFFCVCVPHCHELRQTVVWSRHSVNKRLKRSRAAKKRKEPNAATAESLCLCFVSKAAGPSCLIPSSPHCFQYHLCIYILGMLQSFRVLFCLPGEIHDPI